MAIFDMSSKDREASRKRGNKLLIDALKADCDRVDCGAENGSWDSDDDGHFTCPTCGNMVTL